MALSDKQQAFVEAYLANGFNATKGALMAGYSSKTAYSQGQRLLKNVEISEAVKARIAEMTMSADEALIRLSQHARGSMEDFTDIRRGLGYIDLEKAQKANQLHLLKKFKTGEKGVEIELYDAQAALVQILKEQHLRKGEATDITDDASLTDEARAARIATLLDSARTRRDGQTDSGNSGE